jgi:transposase
LEAIFNVLELTDLEVTVVNAHHIKAVPGRKTDVKDAEWIADLLKHGLLKASFIPERGHRELHELVRYRKSLSQQRNNLVNRVQKLLERANVKLGDVVTDVMGKSGRAMLKAMVEGKTDSAELANLAKGQLARQADSAGRGAQGLDGRSPRYLLGHQLDLIEFLDHQIDELSVEIEERMRPFEPAIQQIMRLPGIGRRSAGQILAEIGVDMSRFPTYHHMSSWAKICPGNNESASKSRSGWTGKGNPWLRAALVEAAWGAARSHRATSLCNTTAQDPPRYQTRRGCRRAQLVDRHLPPAVRRHEFRGPRSCFPRRMAAAERRPA